MLNLTYLAFSDAAKYAVIAKNILRSTNFIGDFVFWNSRIFNLLADNQLFSALSVPPFMPISIAFLFKIFGVNDFAVIATSFTYFLLTLIFVFLLAKKIYKSNFVGILSTIAVAFNRDLINYATGGASEAPFIFEIVAATYFVTLRKTWADIVSVILLISMYFTRPQAFIFIAGIILYYLLLNFKTKKALIYFGIASIVGLLIDRFVLTPLSGKYFIYSILGKGTNVLSQVGVAQSASDQLRSGVLTYNFSILESLKKVFYNLYNFYKLLPQILNPYLFVLFVLGLINLPIKGTEERFKIVSGFKIASLFMFSVTLLVTAASIPFFRYIHPIIPLVYIIAVGTLVQIINLQFTIHNQFTILNLKISKQVLANIVSTFLILLFGVGQTLGIIFLDSRFEKKTHNTDKPPVYVVLSQILKDNTNKEDVVITNLDTWGSWYGERKTVWFPLEPKQIIDPTTGKIPFDAIYLTSYKIDDENYYMGGSWREIFNNPNNPEKWLCDGCGEIAKEFKLKGIYKVDPSEGYERTPETSILLTK